LKRLSVLLERLPALVAELDYRLYSIRGDHTMSAPANLSIQLVEALTDLVIFLLGKLQLAGKLVESVLTLRRGGDMNSPRPI
jgi:hypothetical protein